MFIKKNKLRSWIILDKLNWDMLSQNKNAISLLKKKSRQNWLVLVV